MPQYRIMCAFKTGAWRVIKCYVPGPCAFPVYHPRGQLGILSHTPRQVGKLVNPRKLLTAWQRAQH
jgi:hypothetical protein